MKPIRTERANQVFNPPSGGDAWCDPVWVEKTQRHMGGGTFLPVIKLTYELEPNDLVHFAHGARIELTIIGEGMPPVSMGIVPGPPVVNLAAGLKTAGVKTR